MGVETKHQTYRSRREVALPHKPSVIITIIVLPIIAIADKVLGPDGTGFSLDFDDSPKVSRHCRCTPRAPKTPAL